MEAAVMSPRSALPRPRQCRRQKQKCDRKTPCANCVRRAIPHLCHLPRPSLQWRDETPPGTQSESTPAAPNPSLKPPSLSGSPLPTAVTEPLGPRSQPDPKNPPRIGQLWNSRGAASYHGSSYFGHQSPANMMQVESPELPSGLGGIHASNARRGPQHQSHRSEKGPSLFTYLGAYRLSTTSENIVESLTRKFLVELNPVYDSVHEETFMHNYEAFWNRRWGDDDLTAVDLRWLSLLFIVLAFAELLDCPENATPETQSEHEETSVQYFWDARKAIVLAPTFSGESPDLVRAGILVSRYLLYAGRKTESWPKSSFAIRMAQAQGMHVDGESWGLPPKVLETRRRLWSSLYTLDKSISLAIGRPYTINDKHCMEMNIRNIWIDDKTADEADQIEELPLSDPTPSIYCLYQQKLTATLGNIDDEFFGISPNTTSCSTYEKVLKLDRVFVAWADSLPPYFRLDNSDTSLEASRPYHYWQRNLWIDRQREAELLWKLDIWIAPVMTIIFITAYLDRANIGNVASAGMVDDLCISGDELGNAVTLFYVPYVAAEVPCSLVLKKFHPTTDILLSGIFPCLALYLSTFYQPQEQALRISYLFLSSALSGSFRGLLAYGILHMDGISGTEGWRWLFIIEGIGGAMVAVFVFFMLRDNFENARFLNEEDRKLMTIRAERNARYKGTPEFNWAEVRKAVTDHKL
ncbi:Fc.00g094300.m01.CDS01 [Cosmosporella sp. VM-42]